jgi:hypothetical protein
MVHLIVLAVLFTVGLSQGQYANDSSKETIIRDNSSTMENRSETSATNESMQSLAAPEADESAGHTQRLSYIWSVTGLESGQVIMALSQDGKDLYGAAKYEPDGGQPWNAVVIGSVQGNKVDLVLTSQQGDELISSEMTGTFDETNQSLQGEFIQVRGGKISKRGDFAAIWINPDASSFTPATVEETNPTSIIPDASNAITPEATIDENSQENGQQTSRYHDVHQDADRILTGVGDISQIPIGMGGSGLP